MLDPKHKKYLIVSCALHFAIFCALVFNYEYMQPAPVLKNSNKHDVISAVILGDTIKSKVLPHEKPAAKPPEKAKVVKKKEEPKPVKKVERVVKKSPPKAKKSAPEKIVKKKAIALKASKKKSTPKKAKKKKIVRKDAKSKQKQKDLLAKGLLADIEKLNAEKLKAQKELEKKFAETLRQQSEKTLRQELLDQEIKLQGKRSREMQGIVNKYKALILQAIAENWIVPLQSDRKLTSELMIRLAPGGVVLDVKVTRSSGDPSLDSSARTAVLKSSPLPVPDKSDEFEPFRQFVLKVKPENILEG